MGLGLAALLLSVSQAKEQSARQGLESARLAAKAGLSSSIADLYSGGDGARGDAENPIAFGSAGYFVRVEGSQGGMLRLESTGFRDRHVARIQVSMRRESDCRTGYSPAKCWRWTATPRSTATTRHSATTRIRSRTTARASITLTRGDTSPPTATSSWTRTRGCTAPPSRAPATASPPRATPAWTARPRRCWRSSSRPPSRRPSCRRPAP